MMVFGGGWYWFGVDGNAKLWEAFVTDSIQYHGVYSAELEAREGEPYFAAGLLSAHRGHVFAPHQLALDYLRQGREGKH